jgi:putative acyl-CoA dehydrogenase
VLKDAPEIVAEIDALLGPRARSRHHGMALTEKQGGSDARQHDARRGGRRQLPAYRPNGSVRADVGCVSDARIPAAHLLLVRAGPTASNASISGSTKSANASSEIEYHGAHTVRIGEEGRGVATILEMVHTRLDCAIAPAVYMRSARPGAVAHRASERLRKRLIEQPLMRHVLADLAIESEAATALAFASRAA